MLELLREFYRDKLAERTRHVANARVVADYDFNNTYQYVIAREETHVTWLQAALAEYGVALPPPSRTLEVPAIVNRGRKIVNRGRKTEPSSFSGILEDDARGLAAFVDQWRPRVKTMTHARHRLMLEVILGESIEHQRLFEQAASGLEDVLGRRTGGVARQGAVLPTRWME